MVMRREDVEDVASYINQLNEEEKLWMAKFMDEYNEARLDYQNLGNNLHNTPELKKTCTDRNNARNRCIFAKERAQNQLNLVGSELEMERLIYKDDPDYDEDEV